MAEGDSLYKEPIATEQLAYSSENLILVDSGPCSVAATPSDICTMRTLKCRSDTKLLLHVNSLWYSGNTLQVVMSVLSEGSTSL